jgi:beta-galactosidase
LVFDYESAWAWSIEPQGQDFSYFELVFAFYRGLRRLGLSVDIIPPTPEAVADRKLVVAPGLFTARAELAEALARSGAAVLLGPRSGSKTRDFHIPSELPPGAFRSLVDVKVRRVESLRPGVTLPVEGAAGHLEGWREFLTLGEGVEAQLRSTDGEIVLAHGARAFYLAGRPDDPLLEAVLRRVLACAGLAALDLPRDIRIRDNGATRFVFNYGDTIVDISSIIGDAPLYLGERRLPPCGVAAFAASTA